MFLVFVTLLLCVLSGGLGNQISLDLCQRNITEVRKNANVLESVTSSTIAIALCNNNITKVDSGAFQTYEALEMLNFNANPELQFPSDGSQFLSSQSLMRLDCVECGIIKIYKDTLKGMSNLRQIYLSENMIEMIEDEAFRANRALQEVDLRGNKLTRVPGGIFLGLQSLHRVDLDSNSLLAPHQDQPFLTNDYLKVLSCNECGFEVIYERTFAGLPRLEELYLRQNNIREVQNTALISNEYLNTLMLQDNNIESLSLKLTKIPILSLGGNCIKFDCSRPDRAYLMRMSGVQCIDETPIRVTETYVFNRDPTLLEEIPPNEPKLVHSQQNSAVTKTTTETEIVIGISDWYITSYLTIIYLACSGVLIFLLCVLWKMEKYDSDPGVNFYAEGVLNPSPIYKPIQ
ncbi:leucine-rich repeats and immunoglobulin-like domains protein sma-10 [Toxorhynchites rutilus septentrionalis]|uniref:leucine-rich repeats and immunoglobulin-like domains protein sma-10 n=1 Tax=Toxorhynchites rutilus septentrionalis TaxID=329112 RepID=UPI00247A52F6|nr:leucine-rich repeats and immunoglobulin-like domains protein sma-10 [Toxorhynchites rutilus septentrionalis]